MSQKIAGPSVRSRRNHAARPLEGRLRELLADVERMLERPPALREGRHPVRASLGVRTLLGQIRHRLVAAYQEFARMQA